MITIIIITFTKATSTFWSSSIKPFIIIAFVSKFYVKKKKFN